jgi:hypothetical protein
LLAEGCELCLKLVDFRPQRSHFLLQLANAAA